MFEYAGVGFQAVISDWMWVVTVHMMDNHDLGHTIAYNERIHDQLFHRRKIGNHLQRTTMNRNLVVLMSDTKMQIHADKVVNCQIES